MIQHPVPEELLIHIGDITVSFALLENVIQSFFNSLVQEPLRIGQILSSYLSFKNLRAATISLYLARNGEDADFLRLKEFMNEAGKIEEERNRITHSIWGASDKSGLATRIKINAREKRGFQIEFVDYDEIKFIEFTKQIKNLAANLQLFHIELLEKNIIGNSEGIKVLK